MNDVKIKCNTQESQIHYYLNFTDFHLLLYQLECKFQSFIHLFNNTTNAPSNVTNSVFHMFKSLHVNSIVIQNKKIHKGWTQEIKSYDSIKTEKNSLHYIKVDNSKCQLQIYSHRALQELAGIAICLPQILQLQNQLALDR